MHPRGDFYELPAQLTLHRISIHLPADSVHLLSACNRVERERRNLDRQQGKFKVDAEYAGVKGTSVVLRLPDGTTKEVPIACLSTASRDRAKQLYQAAMSKPAAGQPVSNQPTTIRPTTIQRGLATTSPASLQGDEPDFAPVPPPVLPMPAFPMPKPSSTGRSTSGSEIVVPDSEGI